MNKKIVYLLKKWAVKKIYRVRTLEKEKKKNFQNPKLIYGALKSNSPRSNYYYYYYYYYYYCCYQLFSFSSMLLSFLLLLSPSLLLSFVSLLSSLRLLLLLISIQIYDYSRYFNFE